MQFSNWLRVALIAAITPQALAQVLDAHYPKSALVTRSPVEFGDKQHDHKKSRHGKGDHERTPLLPPSNYIPSHWVQFEGEHSRHGTQIPKIFEA
ncbi:uncharacterized protein PgNI_02136 [Pyricularia grisea]|uniref:Uncharacterized protein n=1 Tax=Pyricularia grisea TaxID=148305 RepID=A0A6P8BIT5_PYRGI|nr:uncharacterized protein PgNI_02136 [Pyricularia grisea]TLD16801.1 hypothetical protein PgNI_02136 [Pyricularia grisea]